MGIIKKAKPADAIDEAEDATEGAAPDETPEAAADDAAAEAEAAAPALEVVAEPEAPAAGADDLLNMFTAVGIETVDRSVLTNLAGDVDMADLVSELNVVAAALGVVMAERSQRAGAREEEPLAA